MEPINNSDPVPSAIPANTQEQEQAVAANEVSAPVAVIEEKEMSNVEVKAVSTNDAVEANVKEVKPEILPVVDVPDVLSASFIGTQSDGATFMSSTINMVNTIIGAGTLSIPSTLLDGGILGALFLLVLSLIFSLYGAHYLAAAAVYTKEDSYGFIGRKLLGKNYGYLADFFMILFDFGISVGYCTIVFGQTSDLLISVVGLSQKTMDNNKWWISTLELYLFMFPILCVPTINALRWTSSFCLLCMFCFILMSIFLGIAQISSADNTLTYYWLPRDPVSFLTAISVFFTCFCSHVNIPKMTSELKLPEHTKFANKLKKMDRVDTFSFTICAVVYYVVGIFGYLGFGDRCSAGNLLDNFQQLLLNPSISAAHFSNMKVLNVLVMIVKLGYLLNSLLSYPVLSFSPLLSIDKTFFKQPRTTKRRVMEAFIWSTCCLLVALVIPSLRSVFSLTGSLCGMVLVFVWPSLYFIYLNKKEKAKEHTKQVRMFKTSNGSIYLAWFLTVLGIIGAIVLTGLEVKNMIDSYSGSVDPTTEPVTTGIISLIGSIF